MSILRKIFKQGSSHVVTVPYYMLEELGLSAGDQVYLDRITDDSHKLIGFSIKSMSNKKNK